MNTALLFVHVMLTVVLVFFLAFSMCCCPSVLASCCNTGECHASSCSTVQNTALSFLLLFFLSCPTRPLCLSSVSVLGPRPSHRGTLHSDPTPCHYFNQMILPPLWGQLSFVDCPFSVAPCPCPCLSTPPLSPPQYTHTLTTTVLDKSWKSKSQAGVWAWVAEGVWGGVSGIENTDCTVHDSPT